MVLLCVGMLGGGEEVAGGGGGSRCWGGCSKGGGSWWGYLFLGMWLGEGGSSLGVLCV